MTFLTESLVSQDCHSWRVVPHHDGVASVADNFLGKSRCVKFVQHDGLSILSLMLVWTIILTQIETEMLSLSCGETRHQSLGLIIKLVSHALGLLEHDRVALSETVDTLVRLVIHERFFTKLIDHGLLSGLHNGRSVMR